MNVQPTPRTTRPVAEGLSRCRPSRTIATFATIATATTSAEHRGSNQRNNAPLSTMGTGASPTTQRLRSRIERSPSNENASPTCANTSTM